LNDLEDDMTETTFHTTIRSPVGELLLIGDGERLRGVYMQEGRRPGAVLPGWRRDPGPFAGVGEQLDEYFAGERTEFDVPLGAAGTAFQQRVWRALTEIPYGVTASYGQIARTIGSPTASRAVGMANGRNPISIIVPCHRVIGAGGKLTGYAGGVERKRYLLELEGRA
jgi:methylated-DNA-[protein]-cysteine S-methyltransferase